MRFGSLLCVALAVLASAAAPAMAQSRELRAISAFSPNISFYREIIAVYADAVHKASGDKIVLRVNGPEVIPFAQQFQPTVAGAFDVLFTHPAYHSGTTALGLAMDAIAPDPAARRSSGVFEFVDKHYNKLGLKVVAITPTGTKGFQYVLKEPIKSSPGLQGLKVRGTVSYHPMIKGLGGAPVVMAPGDVYSALEKGVVDAAAWGTTGVLDLKWHEVAKYLSRPQFGQASLFILMNLKAWSGLTPAQAKLLSEEAARLELTTVKRFDELAVKEYEELKRRGMQETHFAPADAGRLEVLFADGVWEVARAKNGPEADELRAIARRAGLTK